MAIEKNSFKVLLPEFSPHSKDIAMSSDEEDFQLRTSAVVESDDDDDDFDDCDSGAASDDFDLLELGEAGEEFCQVGDQTCSIPYELYDLPSLEDILSLDVWNEVLTEEERFNLMQYLPDMDQEIFLRTLKELFTGCNLHFGNPIDKLYEMLKGGLCEPRVALYRQGLHFFQRRQHYHILRKHQNSMIVNLCQIRDAWSSCKGYSIEEKLQVLNIMKSQKSLMSEKMEELESESSERESGDVPWDKRIKDWKLEQKIDCYGLNSGMDLSSPGKRVALQSASKYTRKGPLPTGNKTTGYDYGAALQVRDQVTGDEEDVEDVNTVSSKKNLNFSRVGLAKKAGNIKMAKKHKVLIGDHYSDSYSPIPWKNDVHAYGRNKPINQLSDIDVLTAKPSSARMLDDYGRKFNYSEHFHQLGAEDPMLLGKGPGSNLSMRGNRIDLTAGNEPYFLGRAPGEFYSAEPPYKHGEWNTRSKKWKMGQDSSDVNHRLFPSEYRAQPLLEKVKANSAQNGLRGIDGGKGVSSFSRNDETESDSSEQVDVDGVDNPGMRGKWAYPSGLSELTSGLDPRKTKYVKKDKQEIHHALDGSSNSSRKMDDFGLHLGVRKMGNYGMRMESKGKMLEGSFLNSSAGRNFDGNYFAGSSRLSGDNDSHRISNLGRESYVLGDYDILAHKDRRRKGDFFPEYVDPQTNFMQDYGIEGEGPLRPRLFAKVNGGVARMGKNGQIVKSHADSGFDRSDAQLISCNSGTKKRKMKKDIMYMDKQDDKEYCHSEKQLRLDESDAKRKKGKRKLEDVNDSLQQEVSEPPESEAIVEDVELDAKAQKKPFILITPTIHTGFSFSIIHLLSAVRMAMITMLLEDSVDAGNYLEKIEGKQVVKEEKDTKTEGANGFHPQGDDDPSKAVSSAPVNVPSLTVQEIVNRVTSNPGDPCILETQEPLQDLIRGVLKIFSSKTAPLGAKGWKSLVAYAKATKSWAWIGPVSQIISDHEAMEEVTSPEAWGLPHKMLVKLVDAFANWLKNGQETLQQIGSLPAPPSSLMQYNSDEKDRFKDLRAQKSLSTISSSSEEVRAYFRKEEVLRYSIPDRAFSYTAADGKKSIVAPLRRCGGKPTSKARDHFMLKRDRPPHVTILCLVRDAAARLPGSIGTRADVCTLIRDSQYIVEDVSDAQVNQVVSGALDRLHYERDPCVQFDGERKLWVYLHREREEEDFEDDGTSSTKKWKRQRKDATEPDQEAVTVAYPGSSEQTGLDLSSDLNVEPQCMDEEKGPNIMSCDDGKDHANIELQCTDDDKGADNGSYDDSKDQVEDNGENSHGSEQGSVHVTTPMAWDASGFNSLQDTGLLCQENSTNEDFDDDPFGKEPPS